VRGRVREAETTEVRQALARELEGLVEEIGEALERNVGRGLMIPGDKKKVLEYLDLLWGEVYGEYNEFKEAKMNAFEKINVRVDREFARMAKAEAQAEARGRAEGEALGMAKGRAEGKVEGKAEAKAEWKAEKKQLKAEIKALKAQLAGGGGGGGSPH
jgi:chromosome segregation ATPase